MDINSLQDGERLRAFFKIFFPDRSKERMKIPSAFTSYMKGNLSPSAYIKDRYGNKWLVKVGQIEDDFFFLDGWAKFVKDSNVELGDFLVFQYDGNCIYDVILLGHSACEMEGAGALQVKEGVEETKGVEEQEEEQMEKTYEVKEEWEDVGEANKVGKEEEEVEEEEEGTNEDKQEEVEESCSDATEMYEDSDYQMEEEDDITQEEEEEDDEEEEVDADEEPAVKTDLKDATEDSTSSHRGLKKIKRGKHVIAVKGDHCTRRHVERSKVTKGGNHTKADEGKRRSRRHVDPYGYDLFKSKCIPQPKNPYFLTKLRARRKDELYVPVDIVKDHNLTLPQEIILVDQQGREWTATLNHWKDGRFWYYGGWASFCRVNIVRYEDTCICEFKRRVGGGLYIEVQIIRPQPQD